MSNKSEYDYHSSDDRLCNLTSMTKTNDGSTRVGYDNAAVEPDDNRPSKTTPESAGYEMQSTKDGKRPNDFIILQPGSGKASKDAEVNSGDRQEEERRSGENFLVKCILASRAALSDVAKSQATKLRTASLILLSVAYFVYLGFALARNWDSEPDFCHGVHLLSVITVVACTGVVYFSVVKRFYGKSIDRRVIKPLLSNVNRSWQKTYVRWTVYVLLVGTLVIFLVVDSDGKRQRLVSACGVIVLTLLGFVFSKHPGHIIWRQVFWGLGLQFIFALMILRWDAGRQIFECLGDKISHFLNFTDEGSKFVYGYLVTGQLTGWNDTVNETFTNADDTFQFDGKLPKQAFVFAFKILPTIFFFSSCISVLYYYGVMQWVIAKLGWLLQVTVGTTAAESMNAAANIFVGQTEAPLVIQPFLPLMTKSELHAVMTGGFATIAGGVLAAYISFGINATDLLSASVMSAPAALGFSKLFYPETEKSSTTASNVKLDRGSERNAIEAAANGAANATFLVANIIANLIAFIALIAFINSVVSWFGSLVGWDFLSFEWILSKLFIPLAFIMGVEWSECEMVARLLGLKTVLNEFVAYAKLGEMVKGKELSPRAQAIATYALCGFSNLSSLGIMLGGLGTMAPQRRSDMAEVAVRGLISGSAACFLTACIAGTLIDEK